MDYKALFPGLLIFYITVIIRPWSSVECSEGGSRFHCCSFWAGNCWACSKLPIKHCVAALFLISLSVSDNTQDVLHRLEKELKRLALLVLLE